MSLFVINDQPFIKLPSLQSPLMPTSATASDNTISLTYSLPPQPKPPQSPNLPILAPINLASTTPTFIKPETILPPQIISKIPTVTQQLPEGHASLLPIPTSVSSATSTMIYEPLYTTSGAPQTSIDSSNLPILTVVKNENAVYESFITFTTQVNQPVLESHELVLEDPSLGQTSMESLTALDLSTDYASSSNISSLLSSLTPVPLSEIPSYMSSTPPPDFSFTLRSGLSSATPVPSVSSPITNHHDDEDVLDSLSTSLDVPLYSYPGPDWSKMANRGQEWTNMSPHTDSSVLDQPWDEHGQTLPLFEPTLDFESLMDFE